MISPCNFVLDLFHHSDLPAEDTGILEASLKTAAGTDST